MYKKTDSYSLKIKILLETILGIVKLSPWNALLSCIVGTITIFFSASLFGLSAYLISLSALHPGFELLMLPVVGVRFLGIGRAASRYLERLISHDTTFMFLRDLRVKIYEKLEPYFPNEEHSTKKGSIIATIISDVETIQDAFLRIAYPIFVAILTLIFGGIVLWQFNIAFSISFICIFILAAFVSPIIIILFSHTSYKETARIKEELYTSFIEFNFGIVEIITNLKQKFWFKKLTDLSAEDIYESKHSINSLSLANAISTFFQSIMFLVSLFISAYLLENHQLSRVMLAVFPLFTSSLFEACLPMYSIFHKIDKASEAVKSLERITNLNCKKSEFMLGYKNGEINQQNLNSNINNYLVKSKNILTINDLYYSYPNKKKIIEKMNLTFQEGDFVLVSGPSGEGKTTFFNIITGFLQNYTGTITINNIDIRKLNHTELLNFFSYVEQKPFLFSGTLKENMLLSNVEATDTELINVLINVGLEKFLNSLPLGLESDVSELGRNFSAGELQRLTISRGLLKKSPFLLFDEPTANLDEDNEKLIFQLLKHESKERGVLIISHKKDYFYLFDKILTIN